MKNLVIGCQGVLITTHNCRNLLSIDTVWSAWTESHKVQELYMQHSAPHKVTFLIVSLSVLTLFLHPRIKDWHKCCRGLSQKLSFLFAAQNNPQNSPAIPNQREKMAETYNIIIGTTEECLVKRKSQEEIWGSSRRLLIAVIQNLQSVLGLDHEKNARESFQPTNPADTKLLWKMLTRKVWLFPKNLTISRKGLIFYHHPSTHCVILETLKNIFVIKGLKQTVTVCLIIVEQYHVPDLQWKEGKSAYGKQDVVWLK